MLSVSLIFGTLISVSTAKGLRVCDDCTTIQQCPQAMNLATSNRSQKTMEKFRNATCRMEKDIMICCSDFLVEDENVQDEIENHPNLQLLTNECGEIASNRLIGRRFMLQYEFPWLVLIASRVSGYIKFDCEGTLINSKYVLTTAHCIQKKHILGVRVGDYSTRTKLDCSRQGNLRKCEKKYKDIAVESIIKHEDYDHNQVQLNDIGLLRLNSPVDLSAQTVGIICLPVYRNLRDNNLYGDRGTVVSWSIVGDETTDNNLLRTTIPIYNPEICRDYFDRLQKLYSKSHEKQILCVRELRPNSCIEGEGAPLMLEGEYNNTYKYIQYGIQAHGPVQCGGDVPGIYIDVRRFMKWILDSIKP